MVNNDKEMLSTDLVGIGMRPVLNNYVKKFLNYQNKNKSTGHGIESLYAVHVRFPNIPIRSI